MRKSILIFVMAIMMGIAAFAQPATPGRPSVREYSNCNIDYLGDYSGAIFWDFTGSSGATYYEAAVAYEQRGDCDYLVCHDYVQSIFTVDNGEDSGIMSVKVRACNTSGCSAWSTASTYGAVSVEAHPTTPTGPSSSYYMSTEQFTAGGNQDGSLYYQWSISGGSYQIVSGATSETISIRFTEYGTTYSIKVRGGNYACGYGDWSGVKTVNL